MSGALVDQYGKPFRNVPSVAGIPCEWWADEVIRVYKDNLKMAECHKIQRLRESMPRA